MDIETIIVSVSHYNVFKFFQRIFHLKNRISQSILQFKGIKLYVKMRRIGKNCLKKESFGRVKNMNSFGNYGNPQKYKDKYDKFHLIHVCFSSFLWMLRKLLLFVALSMWTIIVQLANGSHRMLLTTYYHRWNVKRYYYHLALRIRKCFRRFNILMTWTQCLHKHPNEHKKNRRKNKKNNPVFHWINYDVLLRFDSFFYTE